MTHQHAIEVRSRQLSGEAVPPSVLAEAVWMLRESGRTRGSRRRPFSVVRFAIDQEQIRLLEVELAKS